MRKKIKLFCYVAIVFFIAMFFSYNTSTIEVTTEVKGKLESCDLSKYGGTVKLIKVDDSRGTNWGGGVEISNGDPFNSWVTGPLEVTVRAAASDGAKLSEVYFKLYNSKGKECEFPLSDIPDFTRAKYKNATWKITFNKSIWMDIEGWQIDTDGKEGNKGVDTIKVDADVPEIVEFDVKVDAPDVTGQRYITAKLKVKDKFSGLDFSTISLTVKKDGKTIKVLTDATTTAEEPDVASIIYTEALSTVGDGLFEFTISAGDKVGNFLTKGWNTSTLKVNEETGEVTKEELTGELIIIGETSNDDESETDTPKDDEALSDDFGLLGNENYELTCEGEISNFINKLWNILLIAGPVLMLVMSTIEFVKPILASDADALSKAGSNTVKRAIAFVCLLLLKVILATVLNLFNIQICW